MKRVIIDGSYGEGGGQILRTSIMMATLLGYEVEIYNIRAKRSNPGLRPQHLAAVRTLAEITGGRVEGLKVGSSRIVFKPGEKVRKELRVDVGTAGSITLILQAVLPAVSLRGASSNLVITGGTDTKWSPTASYFGIVVREAFRRLGVDFDMRIARRGYYPRGGGLVEVSIRGANALETFSCSATRSYQPSVLSVYSRLPRHVGDRQAASAEKALREHGFNRVGVSVREEPAISPGTSVLVYSTSAAENTHFVGGDSIGERGVPAEKVGAAAAENFLAEARTGSCVDRHLADMLIPLLVLAEGTSEYLTSELTGHMETNAYIAMKFAEKAEVSFEKREKGVAVRVKGAGLIR